MNKAAKAFQHVPDKPWIFRTYAGHSSVATSNALFKRNLAKGQTGLSIAFDLPTQTALDCDHVLARGEVGKVGVPVAHLGQMRELFAQIPLDQMNSSMTINAPAAWMLALYVALADEQNVARDKLQGTTQNDLIKEFLSRGSYVFAPEPSLKLTTDIVEWSYRETPRFNPTNICSYHLQEAGATPEIELAFALAAGMEILDRIFPNPTLSEADFSEIFGRISFFVNSGTRFVTEICKMRAFCELWEKIGRERYGVTDPKALLFRYGVQVNSLGLTEQQPENNVYRILLSALGVTLSKKARCRALQLPAWNEALGLPRPFDQQWSLRIQQILALETDLLEFEDIFDGSPVIEAKVHDMRAKAGLILNEIAERGGVVKALSFMKKTLVDSHAQRWRELESGERAWVGVNLYRESESSPLNNGDVSAIEAVDPRLEAAEIAQLQQWRQKRDAAAVTRALSALREAAQENRNIMEASIQAAKAGVTTGEWGLCLREVFGTYRGPTGVELRQPSDPIAPEAATIDDQARKQILALRARILALGDRLGRPLAFLLAKPGLDGHSNGAEQIALRAHACGMEVTYDGIRSTPEEIVARALETQPHLIGLSILSGSHLDLTGEVMRRLREAKLDHVPLIVGGIIPPEDELILRQYGVRAVYTPKDFRLNEMIGDMLTRLEQDS